MAKIDALLEVLRDREGSDLHLSPTNPPILRIHGILKPLDMEPTTHDGNKEMLYEIMSEGQKRRFEQALELDFAYEVQSIASRFRTNVFYGRYGLTAVFRLIPNEIKSLEELGLPPQLLKCTQFPQGLIVFTGATGSGKSTTLAALIDHINTTRSDHIITIEDPIEFVHESKQCLVNQREVGKHTRSFAASLRAALREDPDVILVGEMRDLETIELAITAAETGHLVFSTLHTSSASKTVDRIINVFPSDQQEQIRTMLCESLKGVIAQHLLKTIDGRRAVAVEILWVTPAVANLIREGKTYQIPSAIQTGKGEGMQLLDQAIMDLLKARRIAPEEAFRVARNKAAFETMLGRSAPVAST
ncbi:twitching motility protein [candidate division TA06 bacterium DG_24]|uniref:Twitching motility protein n=3 Tax=Bacteria division TA06 TaxID=1156500 RepID=A0A0S8JGV7_UNCT6|nr:MAG: twitching motility protein [candidate division TA06 bacterium DG_24]KPK68995.1 MAG: twitching motility protein [candidate division TA06 bacterium SM23_40]KPL09001.1 MAG: twitching motility protein [candidate division TA06 bacterium SM1_40]